MKKRKIPQDMFDDDGTVRRKSIIHNVMSQSEILVLEKIIKDGFNSGFWKGPCYEAYIPMLKTILQRITRNEPDLSNPFEMELKKKKDADWNEVWEEE